MVDRTEIFSLLLTDMSHWRGPVSLTCWPWPPAWLQGPWVSPPESPGCSIAPRQLSVPPWLSSPTPPSPLPSSPLALIKALPLPGTLIIREYRANQSQWWYWCHLTLFGTTLYLDWYFDILLGFSSNFLTILKILQIQCCLRRSGLN